ncbi:MAG: c-type cytochrome [Ignavibacteria bacterium]|nr:c-type cytochrome [Ignavibacteria bacterium]
MKKLNQRLFVLSCSALLILCYVNSGCNKDEKQKQVTENKTDSIKSENLTNSSVDSPGKQLFYMKSNQNNIACADCHSDGTNTGKGLTKYFSGIAGADKRVSAYHGRFTGEEVAKNAGGATVCWESYLKMKTPMTEEQIKSLNDFYSSLATNNSPSEVKYETISLPVKDKAKLKTEQNAVMKLTGDASKGETTFNNACGFCHGQNSTIKKIPDLFDEFEGNVKSITYNVRFGDGAMPFFKNSVLSEQDIADISAYIMKKNGK